MQNDVEIAQCAQPKPIRQIAERLGILMDELEPYGKYKAKVYLDVLDRLKDKSNGKLILVTAINPTAAGEGKTTVTVGLGQALDKLGKNACIAIREPSLGPCFGIKGGAAGGGYAQVLPMEDINLHFTGDIHAITTAHNLLSALIDNHLHFGNSLRIRSRSIAWKRVMDMNDRSLRNIVIGLGGDKNGVPRQDGFDISSASEVMAILCLANSMNDLKERLSHIVVAYNEDGDPVTAGDLNAQGAMALILKDAIKPNLVQTIEGTPAFVHGGPFANIAHGCNSVLATNMALRLSDYVVTEAGFGADLGAEKFFDIKCRSAHLTPDAAVVVASIRALKMHGGVTKEKLASPDPAAVSRGLENLYQHVENVKVYGIPLVVALNQFVGDTPEELETVLSACKERKIPVALTDVWARGGEGGLDLAQELLHQMENPGHFRFLYDLNLHTKGKIAAIATEIYGAERVVYTQEADKKIKRLEQQGFNHLPICMAKTQYSLSDNPHLLGKPQGFALTVNDIRLAAGAGYIVAYTGSIMTMPGLPQHPAAENMDIDENGMITGLF